MVYQQNFVAVVCVDGKILREKDENTVYLPFKSDYSLRLKNLNSKTVEVRITIDGEDVLDDSQLVIAPNTTFDLEGFLDGMEVRKKFRFIQKTKEIVNHRGDDIEDGIIRIEYRFEKDQPFTIFNLPDLTKQEVHHHHHYNDFTYRGGLIDSYQPTIFGASGDCNITSSLNTSSDESASVYNVSSSIDLGAPDVDEGITVKGADTHQQFGYATIGQLEEHSSVITLKLKGYDKKGKVKKSLTVRTKVQCESCGRKWKSSFNFCPNCTTALN
ncbi:MAG: hypothetical protein KAS32_01995 [Candidatus Peribacteraceae bacterium]|nr:hypothetical protein [Candidatus Peribacteraceae bacterium]